MAFSVAANTEHEPRTGTLTIAGQTFTVTQAARRRARYTIAPTSQSVAAGGGTGPTTVTAPAGCAWTARSNAVVAHGHGGRERQRQRHGGVQRRGEYRHDARAPGR